MSVATALPTTSAVAATSRSRGPMGVPAAPSAFRAVQELRGGDRRERHRRVPELGQVACHVELTSLGGDEH